MANPPRNRKRVRALRRAPDGSAFQKCDDCGASVPVILMDMHECEGKKDVKRFKGKSEQPVVKKRKNSEEPKSAFLFFSESYAKTCNSKDMIEINRKAYEKWKTMSIKERWPYILQAEKMEKAYMAVLLQEVAEMSQVDDEADSAMVGKCVQDYENSGCSDSSCSYWWEECEGLDTYNNKWSMPCFGPF